MSLKKALVVGGTSGIGHGIARVLAASNYSVCIVGRDVTRGLQIVRELDSTGGKEHSFIPCDAFLVKNIYQFADDFKKNNPKLDILVLTQGMASISGRVETPEGIDKKLALHYFGRMAFIDALLPILRNADKPKVLSVLSAGHHRPYMHYRNDFELEDNFSIANAAYAAGFYNDVALESLSKLPENSNVTFIHSYPGIVATNWGSSFPATLRYIVRFLQRIFGRSIDECGQHMCKPLLDDNLAPGFYLIGKDGEPMQPTEMQAAASDVVYPKTMELLKKINEHHTESSTTEAA